MSYRSKTLSLQRAYFNEGFNSTLETVLRNMFDKLPSAQDRMIKIDFYSRQLFASFDDAAGKDGIFVRVLEFEDGAIGVINLDTANSSAVVEEFLHPKKQDFLKEEIVFYVVRNHIVACNLNNKKRPLADNILTLAQKAGVLGNEVHMKIAEVPDQTTLDHIQEVGVREVDFKITSFMENLNIPRDQKPGSRIMQMILGMPADHNTTRKRANATGRIILKRGGFKKDEIRRDQWLTDIGAELMIADSSDDFNLILEDGSKISNASLKKSKIVKLPRHANSFSFEHAKRELASYYNELASDGSLGA